MTGLIFLQLPAKLAFQMAGTKRYNSHELKKDIKKLARKLGKPPSTKNVNRHGPAKAETIKRYFLNQDGYCPSWNEVLKDCGLSPLSEKYSHHWTKDEVLSWMRVFYDQNGRLPRQSDKLPNKKNPPPSTVGRLFGSWSLALKSEFGKSNRRRDPTNPLTKEKCMDFLRNLGRYHTHREINLLSKEQGTPHSSTIVNVTGKTPAELQEEIGYKRKFGIFGPIPLYWEKFCVDIARSLYGNIQKDFKVVEGRRCEIFVPSEKLLIDAMTSAYKFKDKEKRLKDYLRSHRVECWCIRRGTEYCLPNLTYLYPEDLKDRISRADLPQKKKKELLKRLIEFDSMDDKLLEKAGLATRKGLINDLKKFYRANGKVPKQSDMEVSQGFFGYQTYSRYFDSWNDALKQAGLQPRFNRKWTGQQIIESLRELQKTKVHRIVPTDLRKDHKYPAYTVIRKFFASWESALESAGLLGIAEKHKKEKWNKVKIMKRLQEYHRKTGEPITFTQLGKNGLPPYTTLRKYFGSIQNALLSSEVPGPLTFWPYTKAVEYVKKLEFKGNAEFRRWATSPARPMEMPSNPNSFYKKTDEWKSWPDFLGYKRKSRKGFLFTPFRKARKLTRNLKIKSRNEWSNLARLRRLPEELPRAPDRHYRNKGWLSWGNWLGTGVIAPQLKHLQFKPFLEARRYVRNLGLKSERELREKMKSKSWPREIPKNPASTYKNDFKGIADWIGSKNIAPKDYKWISYAEAKAFAQSNGIKTKNDWMRYAKKKGLPKGIPVTIDRVFRRKSEWTSWHAFLK